MRREKNNDRKPTLSRTHIHTTQRDKNSKTEWVVSYSKNRALVVSLVGMRQK